MSEFECRNGHSMRPGTRFCTEPGCYEPVFRMDGKTNAELEREEADADRYDVNFHIHESEAE